MQISSPIESVRGIGPQRAAALAREDVRTIGDLLTRLPFRYEDRRVVSPVAQLVAGGSACVRGMVEVTRLRRARRMRVLESLIADESGRMRAVWFNQPYLQRVLVPGQKVALVGPVVRDPRAPRYLTMSSPEHQLIDANVDSGAEFGRVVPVYERVGPVSGRMLRSILGRLVADLSEDLPEQLPSEVSERLRLPPLGQAFRGVHAPDAGLDDSALAALAAARSPGHLRLILEELFVFQLSLSLVRSGRGPRRGLAAVLDERVRAVLRGILPFRLTEAQRRVAREIAADLRAAVPMRRLLQGDVGAGKTVLALLAMVIVVEQGAQAALMAPTELLAEQHFLTFRRLLAGRGYRVELMTSSLAREERLAAMERIASGEAQIVIGTHALAEPGLGFCRLGLAVVDEQHRFGVLQREALTGKAESLDLLVMTATPIPRTLALTAYGDLDVSRLDELPPGRTPVRTLLRGAAVRREIVELVRHEVAQGHQAYVVFPIVEESEQLPEVRAAMAGLEEWRCALPGLCVELLHGRMRAAERELVMQRFARGEIVVLVATTVIEVGIDVANATLMVVEHAERFGLAQLHQLRGRVGRGPAPSTCVMMTHGRLTADARARLNALLDSQDGFVIAEQDLAIRGPGEMLGTRQSGLARFRMADLARDHDLIEQAHDEAERFVAEHGRDEALRWLTSTGWESRLRLA
jgi:ATP-dependent DNA helicase RecG